MLGRGFGLVIGVLAMLAGLPALATEVCRIHDPELRTSYRGGCNREGYAEGIGAAKGSAEYVGEFRAGRKHGRGVKVWPWGDRYVGDFVEDRKEGHGMYIWGAQAANAGDSYLGDYLNDRRHGRGVYQWASGERYEGAWANDLMTGPATAMAVQRGRHQKALIEAVMKPGAVVCREIEIGIGTKERVRATVVQANIEQRSIAVRADRLLPVPVAGVTIKAGDVYWDSAVPWEPCQ